MRNLEEIYNAMRNANSLSNDEWQRAMHFVKEFEWYIERERLDIIEQLDNAGIEDDEDITWRVAETIRGYMKG